MQWGSAPSEIPDLARIKRMFRDAAGGLQRMSADGSFLTWLALQAQRDDAVGDCARDMLDDPDWPPTATTLETARAYLESVHASRLAIEALREAWDEWQRRR